MNIFVLDEDIQKCAEYHIDSHCIKMIVETAQLLCTAHWMNGVSAPYKKTHYNHPCAVWTRESIQNYNWLCELGIALCKEYSYRYNKTHKTLAVLNWLKDNKPVLPNIGITKFALAMPDFLKSESAIDSYRMFYAYDKYLFAKWKNRDIPEWFKINYDDLNKNNKLNPNRQKKVKNE